MGFYFFTATPEDFNKLAFQIYSQSLGEENSMLERSEEQCELLQAQDLLNLLQSDRLSDYATDEEDDPSKTLDSKAVSQVFDSF